MHRYVEEKAASVFYVLRYLKYATDMRLMPLLMPPICFCLTIVVDCPVCPVGKYIKAQCGGSSPGICEGKSSSIGSEAFVITGGDFLLRGYTVVCLCSPMICPLNIDMN